MHIAMLSDFTKAGGAAIAESRLYEALDKNGIKISRIVGIRDYLWPNSQLDFHFLSSPIFGKYWPRFVSKMGIYSLNRIHSKISGIKIRKILKKLRPDIINIHNIHGSGWTPEIVSTCLEFAPVVWTLHDMWSFTGRCAYNYDCNLFSQGCNASCPTAGEYPPLRSPSIFLSWKERQTLFEKSRDNLVAVTPSQWLANQAIKGLWGGHRVEVIPNGLPLDKYRPVDRITARNALGIKENGPIFLAAAQYLFERRKGGNILLEALEGLHVNGKFITFGMDSITAIHDHEIFNLGFIPEEQKIFALNAADFYIHPAPVDNLPNIVMEAIACGTPVVGFVTGGVPEMVRDGITGWLAPEVNPDSLRLTIKKAIQDTSSGHNFRNSCRNVAENEYNVLKQADRYTALFQSIIS